MILLNSPKDQSGELIVVRDAHDAEKAPKEACSGRARRAPAGDTGGSDLRYVGGKDSDEHYAGEGEKEGEHPVRPHRPRRRGRVVAGGAALQVAGDEAREEDPEEEV